MMVMMAMVVSQLTDGVQANGLQPQQNEGHQPVIVYWKSVFGDLFDVFGYETGQNVIVFGDLFERIMPLAE